MNKTLFLLLSTVLTLISCEQPKPDAEKETLFRDCDKFMQVFSHGKFTEAVQTLKQNSLLGDQAIDSLAITCNRQMNTLDARFGKISSYQYLGDKSIRDFITRRTYFLLFDGNYLKVDFTLYKSKYGWKITGFEYNTEIDNYLK